MGVALDTTIARLEALQMRTAASGAVNPCKHSSRIIQNSQTNLHRRLRSLRASYSRQRQVQHALQAEEQAQQEGQRR